MRIALTAFIGAALLVGGMSAVHAEVIERVLKVTFVSTELVYLNGGRAEGLTVGAKPAAWRSEQRVSDLEVIHLAEHSSACRVVGPDGGVRVGDEVRISVTASVRPDTSVDQSIPVEGPAEITEPVGAGPSGPVDSPHPPTVSGNVAILYSDWNDEGAADMDYAQMRLDLDLRAEPLWTPGLSFVMRSSGRQDRHDGSVARPSKDDWEGRIATFALEYRPAGSPVGMAMGRINPTRVGAIGRLDGGSIEYRLSSPLRLGVFAGANSQWQYAENRPDLQTYGMFAGYRRGSARELLVDQTVATVAQYHGRTASREALLAQGRIMRGGRWNLSHSIELDINRGWRRDEAGETISLSTVFAQGQVNLSKAVAATVSYDTRKSFRTYETRDVADSIFDDRVRQGVRGQLDVRFPNGISLSGGAGLRMVAGETDRTRSFNGAAHKQGVFNTKSSLSVSGVTFSGETSNGYNVTASLGQGFRQRDWISLGGGVYSYTIADGSPRRLNRRADLSVRIGLARSLALNALGQLNGGDDTRGHRLEAGMSFQF